MVRKTSERKAHLYLLEREGRASHVRVRAYTYMRLLSPLHEKEATSESAEQAST